LYTGHARRHGGDERGEEETQRQAPANREIEEQVASPAARGAGTRAHRGRHGLGKLDLRLLVSDGWTHIPAETQHKRLCLPPLQAISYTLRAWSEAAANCVPAMGI